MKIKYVENVTYVGHVTNVTTVTLTLVLGSRGAVLVLPSDAGGAMQPPVYGWDQCWSVGWANWQFWSEGKHYFDCPPCHYYNNIQTLRQLDFYKINQKPNAKASTQHKSK